MILQDNRPDWGIWTSASAMKLFIMETHPEYQHCGFQFCLAGTSPGDSDVSFELVLIFIYR